MDPLILAERNAKAQARIMVASEVLASRLNLPPEVAGGPTLVRYPQDPEVERLFQREAVADLLDALVEATKPKKGKKAPAPPEENPELKPEDPTIPPPEPPGEPEPGAEE